ncbi:hypothetical protein HZU77_008875 [Neisseriaceae bacterium TC5R-5]|nr:hypothetical protein [Neisseriaceae bacterium TC5R-5]
MEVIKHSNAISLFGILILISPIFLHARSIDKITITEAGRMSTVESDKRYEPTCKQFKPTLKQVRNYFTKAYTVPGKLMVHDRYAPCYATGSIKYSDGFQGKWRLYSSGTAWLEWLDGGKIYLLYKKNKWLDPTAGMYDDDGQEY